MVSLDEVQQDVERRYALLDPPVWPPPRGFMEPPREEEYSRTSEPERWRAVLLRGRAWAAALADLPGVELEVLPAGPEPRRGAGRYDRGHLLRSSRPGTSPVRILEIEGEDPVHWSVGVGEGDTPARWTPHCGCDACDDGSEVALTEVDSDVHAALGAHPGGRARPWFD